MKGSLYTASSFNNYNHLPTSWDSSFKRRRMAQYRPLLNFRRGADRRGGLFLLNAIAWFFISGFLYTDFLVLLFMCTNSKIIVYTVF